MNNREQQREIKFDRKGKFIVFKNPYTGRMESIFNDTTIVKITEHNTTNGTVMIHYYNGRKHLCHLLLTTETEGGENGK